MSWYKCIAMSRVPDKTCKINFNCLISSPNPMFEHLLELSQWDLSNKWSNIGFDEEIGIIEIKIHLSEALYEEMGSMNIL